MGGVLRLEELKSEERANLKFQRLELLIRVFKLRFSCWGTVHDNIPLPLELDRTRRDAAWRTAWRTASSLHSSGAAADGAGAAEALFTLT